MSTHFCIGNPCEICYPHRGGWVTGPILNGLPVHPDVYFAKYPPPSHRPNYWNWRVVLSRPGAQE